MWGKIVTPIILYKSVENFEQSKGRFLGKIGCHGVEYGMPRRGMEEIKTHVLDGRQGVAAGAS